MVAAAIEQKTGSIFPEELVRGLGVASSPEALTQGRLANASETRLRRLSARVEGLNDIKAFFRPGRPVEMAKPFANPSAQEKLSDPSYVAAVSTAYQALPAQTVIPKADADASAIDTAVRRGTRGVRAVASAMKVQADPTTRAALEKSMQSQVVVDGRTDGTLNTYALTTGAAPSPALSGSSAFASGTSTSLGVPNQVQLLANGSPLYQAFVDAEKLLSQLAESTTNQQVSNSANTSSVKNPNTAGAYITNVDDMGLAGLDADNQDGESSWGLLSSARFSGRTQSQGLTQAEIISGSPATNVPSEYQQYLPDGGAAVDLQYLAIQRAIQRYSQAISAFSNSMSKYHQASMTAINNLKA
jgi:hypothetical protein